MEVLSKYENFASKLFKEHNLLDWKFVYNKRTTSGTFGICKYRTKEIHINYRFALAAPEYMVIDTIIHEVAHALTKGHGHDNIWKQKCIELGCKPNRTKSIDKDIESKLSKFVGICPTCQNKIYSNSDKSKIVHVKCSNIDYQKTGKSNFSKHIYVWKFNNDFIKLNK